MSSLPTWTRSDADRCLGHVWNLNPPCIIPRTRRLRLPTRKEFSMSETLERRERDCTCRIHCSELTPSSSHRVLTTDNALYRPRSPPAGIAAPTFGGQALPGLHPPPYELAYAGDGTAGTSFVGTSTAIPLHQSPARMTTVLTDPPAMWPDTVNNDRPQPSSQDRRFTYVELDPRAGFVADDTTDTTWERPPFTSRPLIKSACR